MSKPRALDLFCSAGGATKGLQNAGFHVTGVDIKPQPRYCGDAFHQADALEFLIEGYDLIWASPPCQAFTKAQNAAKNAHAHPNLIPATRARLMACGVPWVIENVPGAPLLDPAILCGLGLGLKVARHRLFESSFFWLTPGCPGHRGRHFFTIFGHACHPAGQRGRVNDIKAGREAMGIDWMNRSELSEAIPPAYSELIGRAALALKD